MRIFFDANCLFAAVKSPTGGAARIIEIASIRGYTICITDEVIAEAKRNLVRKIGAHTLIRLREILLSDNVEITDNATPEEEHQWQGVTVEKDCHILASALKAGVNVIISFDRKHILTPKVRGMYPLPVMEPGDFLKDFIADYEKGEQ